MKVNWVSEEKMRKKWDRGPVQVALGDDEECFLVYRPSTTVWIDGQWISLRERERENRVKWMLQASNCTSKYIKKEQNCAIVTGPNNTSGRV